MGRLPLGALPKMSRHPSGQARVRLGREEHWIGRFGSPEAQRRYDAIIRRILDQRNSSAVPAALPVAVEPEAAPDLPPSAIPVFKLGIYPQTDQPCAVAEA